MNYADTIFVAFAVAATSITLTRSQLTKHARREWVNAPLMLGELVSCPYCMAHWVALLFAWLLNPPTLMWYFVYALILVGISAVIIGVILRLWMMQESELEDQRELLREAKEALKGVYHG